MNWNTPEMFSFIAADEEEKEGEVEKSTNYAAKCVFLLLKVIAFYSSL